MDLNDYFPWLLTLPDSIFLIAKKSILLLYILENADEPVVKIPRPLSVVIERRDPGYTLIFITNTMVEARSQ